MTPTIITNVISIFFIIMLTTTIIIITIAYVLLSDHPDRHLLEVQETLDDPTITSRRSRRP